MGWVTEDGFDSPIAATGSARITFLAEGSLASVATQRWGRPTDTSQSARVHLPEESGNGRKGKLATQTRPLVHTTTGMLCMYIQFKCMHCTYIGRHVGERAFVHR